MTEKKFQTRQVKDKNGKVTMVILGKDRAPAIAPKVLQTRDLENVTDDEGKPTGQFKLKESLKRRLKGDGKRKKE